MSARCPSCFGVGLHFPGCPAANVAERCPSCDFVLPAHANGCAALGAPEPVTMPCPGPGCGDVVPVDGRCPFCDRLLVADASGTPDPQLPDGVPHPLGSPPEESDQHQADSTSETTYLLHRLPPVLEESYEAVEDLGGGGQGFVLKCLPRQGGDPVAIKVYSGSLPVPSDELFQQLQACSRDHVTPILAFGRTGSVAWEIQEYFPLGTLGDWMTGEPWDEADVRHTLTELYEAIEHVHTRGIVHRDLKPQNIFIRGIDPLDCVLGDFGLAKQLTMGVEIGSIAGALAYMPPEAAFAGMTSEESDWWALGVIIRQLLTGKHLFASPIDQTNMLDKRLMRAELFRGRYETTVADERWTLLLQGLLTYEQEHRWGGEEVSEWLAGGSPEVYSGPVTTPTRPARPLPFLGESCADPMAVAAVIRRRYDLAKDYLTGTVRTELMTWLSAANDADPAVELLGSDNAWKSRPDHSMVYLQLDLDPDAAPSYRGRELTGTGLQQVIREATARDQSAGEWIGSLRSDRILSLVDRLATDPGRLGAADESLRMWWVEIDRRTRTLGTDERQLWKDSRGIAEGLALSAALSPDSRAALLAQGAAARGDVSSLPEALATATAAARTDLPDALLAIVLVPAWREQQAARERAAQEREKARRKAEREEAARQAAEAARLRRRQAFDNARLRVWPRFGLHLVPAVITGVVSHLQFGMPVSEAALWSAGTLAGVVAALFVIDLVLRQPGGRGTWSIGWLAFLWSTLPIVTWVIDTAMLTNDLVLPSPSVLYRLPIPLVVGYGLGSALTGGLNRLSSGSVRSLRGQGWVSLLAGIPLVTLPAIRMDAGVVASLSELIPSWYETAVWTVYQYVPSLPLTTSQQLVLIAVASVLAVYWLLLPDRLLAIPHLPRWVTVGLLIVLWLAVAVTSYGSFTFGLLFFSVPVIAIHWFTRR